MSTKTTQVGIATITFTDNSIKILKAMKNGMEAALINVGIAAKHNVQNIILDKDIYDTGELYRTIDYDAEPQNMFVHIGSPKNYAIYNEFGTSKMAARPFIQPGVLNKVEEYKQIVADTIASKIK